MRQRVIHKDLKPANILVNPTTKEVKLIDFSIASLLPRETQQLQNPNILEGTLAYISPEQTGRMNRGIDYRTDFYSLGVTFFELLAGQLPFSSNDPIELVHCHIAKQPSKIHTLNPCIPSVLSDIVAKLMAKNAEDRYQSARGLKHDLEVCKQQWQETGNIAPFKLGTRDLSERFLIPEKLYGRQAEVKALLDAFDRVSSEGVKGDEEGNFSNNPKGNPSSPLPAKMEMMLIAGFSGIGKTAVVNEVHKPIVEARGYFIKGKYDHLIDLYQQHYPNPVANIQAEIEAMDLEYVRDDLPKLLHSMKEGVVRICNISDSLRTFSRKDTDSKVPFNIHDGIDSTILILKHRLRANETRPVIEVVKDYGNLPYVNCFPGQLNQVFMNLLANAIDALEESNTGRSFEEIQAHPNQITIRTQVGSGEEFSHIPFVVIRIKDNGMGISAPVKQHIFDHLFTTKSVGKGTGLGLAIARQIVVEKHGGALEVNSALGQGAEFVIFIPL